MKRRNFIKLSANVAFLLAFSGVYTPLRAEDSSVEKVVVNLMLDGGPDFRYLIVPAYIEDDEGNTDEYTVDFWQARASIWNANTESELKEAYTEHYDDVTISGYACGVLKKCKWLIDEIDANNVAIINNVIASTNRNHHHSQVILEHGSTSANEYNLDVSGWAGRAAKELGANVISLTREVRLVCNGPHATDLNRHDNSCVIVNYDSRDGGLYSYDTQADLDNGSNNYQWSHAGIIGRALQSYYKSKRPFISENSPYHKAIAHEKQIRDFGTRLKEKLDTVTIPESIQNLSTGDTALKSSAFAKQILSLYDSYQTRDILGMKLASMEYSGWDSHKNTSEKIAPKLEDIFGESKGLDSLIGEIGAEAYNETVIVIAGEFGRQLVSNGDHGSDHGRGNSMLVIGGKVNGGFYGDPFPDEDFTVNADILGKTSMFQVYASVLDWQESDLGAKIFNLNDEEIEESVDLSTMIET